MSAITIQPRLVEQVYEAILSRSRTAGSRRMHG